MVIDKEKQKVDEGAIKEVTASAGTVSAGDFFSGFFNNDRKANESAEKFLENNLNGL